MNTEYSVEPNGEIGLHNARLVALTRAAQALGYFTLEGLTRHSAYEIKAELEPKLSFSLRVRGTMAG